MGFQPSVDRKGIQPIGSSGVINPTFFTNLFRVGFKSHTVLLIARHVAQGEALDRDRSAPIEWTRGPRITHQARALLNRVITATIECNVAEGGALIGRSAENPRVDRVDADHRS